MRIQHFPVSSLLGGLACALLASPAWAGGILLYETGQEGAGLANAGAAVLTDDPSVLMNNPAGLTAVPGTQVSLNGQLVLGDIAFSRDADNQFGGNEGGNILQYLPSSSMFISHQINERASIGFGMYGNFGLTVDYDDDWAGRYFTQEATILGMSLQPTYAYKVNDDLSIGFGPRLMFAYYRTEVAINNNLLGASGLEDGQLEYKDTATGLGLNLGLLYQLNERTRLGLAYTSKVDLEFEDRPQVDDISNPALNTALSAINLNQLSVDMTVPQTVLASLSYDLDAQWKLLGSLGWQDWSEFGNIGVEVDADALGASTSVDRQYKDTWHASLGTQYQINPQLRWNFGVGYDSSMVDDEDRTVDNPTGESWRLASGINYQVDEGLDLHMAYTLVWLADMDVEQTKQRSGTSLSGSYDNSALHILGAGATWRF
jgi:long-chain fatty acid transport protein